MQLSGRRVVVGVGGGIAAFKAAFLVRELGRRGAELRVVMTRNATRFIGATTFTGLTGKPAIVDLWDPAHAGEVHVELGQWAEAIVVAPATASVLARAAHGMADDALLATLSCAACPVLFAPAMHERMWLSAATQRNVRTLQQDGALLVGPVAGALASGQSGLGRMAEPDAIADAVATLLAKSPHAASNPEAVAEARGDLAKKTVLISAGPTIEDIDPVRFISNRSSGRMGFALASAARERGARVILVCGPTAVPAPAGLETIEVRSAQEMAAAIDRELARADAVIMTAAVADYRPAQVASAKIKKKSARMSIDLVKNPDILSELGARRRGRRPVLVGFAMETNDLLAHARKKLVAKKCDLIVANEAAVGFGRDDTQATLVSAAGDDALPPMSKRELANRILDRVLRLF
jgi:phosphopantothenoylcysteine decarboxylase/phosphopantothenate--cysteine ligase